MPTTGESGTGEASYKGMSHTPHQTADFVDGNQGNEVTFNTNPDSTFDVGSMIRGQLADFLSRPVIISTFTWNQGALLNQSINPWHLFFSDSRIVAKLNHYYLLRCNLKIKVVINGSPFLYGLGYMGYQPLNTVTSVDLLGSGNKEFFLQLSQLPGAYFYPHAQQGVEMTLPFFYNENWLDATSATDLIVMGKLLFESPEVLRRVGGTGGSVTLQVYAWAEDVHLAGPTTSLAVQSGIGTWEIQTDEYDSKPSQVASAIAEASGALSRTPLIGPLARTTQMVAKAGARFASALGFTNVPNISPVCAYRHLPMGGLSGSDISVPTDKLTIDSKNELSIDPRTVGLGGDDDMDFSVIAKKESYVDSFQWSTSDGVDANLWNGSVTPHYLRTASVTGGTAVYSIPVDHLARCFKFWTGTIIFRIRIVCTPFHRGRLLVSWDPHGAQWSSSASAIVTTIYNRVIDISAETDVEIAIPFSQPGGYLETRRSDDLTVSYSTSAPVPHLPHIDNGVIKISTLTNLTSNDETVPIDIVVSVRGGDDFDVADPAFINGSVSWYQPQSGLSEWEVQSDFLVKGASAPTEKTQEQDIAPLGSIPLTVHQVYFGEKVSSLRQLLRRSTLSRVSNLDSDSSPTVATLHTSLFYRYPLMPGYDLNGIHTTTTAAAFNFVNWHFLSWFSPCYGGIRGAMNWTMNLSSRSNMGTFSVSRNNLGPRTLAKYYKTTNIPATPSHSAMANLFTRKGGWLEGSTGMAAVNQNSQTSLQVAAPNYSNRRFLNTNPISNTMGTSYDLTHTDSLQLQLKYTTSSGAVAQSATVEYYAGAGTDLTLFWFLYVPVKYLYSSYPTPAV